MFSAQGSASSKPRGEEYQYCCKIRILASISGKPLRVLKNSAECGHGCRMGCVHNRSGSRRIQQNSGRRIRTTPIKGKEKLETLVSRAKKATIGIPDILPVEAIITVTEHEWIWQVVDQTMLNTLSHRIILDNPTLGRRELVMTSGIDAAVGVARTVTEIEGGCVLIETLEP